MSKRTFRTILVWLCSLVLVVALLFICPLQEGIDAQSVAGGLLLSVLLWVPAILSQSRADS